MCYLNFWLIRCPRKLNLPRLINDLKAFPGEKFQNKIYNYLLAIGVPASELDSVINILTEGTKAQGNDNCQQVITAENFTSEDLELKTETSQANPKKYYSLEKDCSVTATFDFNYTGEAKLVAYLGNPNRISDTSKKIAESIEVSIDGEYFEQDEVSYADAGFGQGDGRNYYSAVVLGTIDVYPYEMEVNIEGNDSDLNIGAISVWFGIACTVMMVVICCVTGPAIRKIGTPTVPDLFGKLFGGKTRMLVACIMAPLS